MAGMQLRDVVGDSGGAVYLWLERIVTTAAGPRPQAFLAHYPAVLQSLSREQATQHGYSEATHLATGPYWSRRAAQAGDLLTTCKGRDGLDYVRPGKPWKVVGRRHVHGQGDLDHQSLYLKEEI